jgi:hypothetical protein
MFRSFKTANLTMGKNAKTKIITIGLLVTIF